MDKPIKKYMKFVLCAIISSCGCTRNNQEDYTIGLPIENCSMVSYDNHNLTDNGVNIYCPSGSVVVAAMDGVVITLKKDSIDWMIETICPSNNLISHYSYVSYPTIHHGDTLSMNDTIGVSSYGTKFLHYSLYYYSEGDTIFLNPLPKFNECFE